jgi:hypothetical protein
VFLSQENSNDDRVLRRGVHLQDRRLHRVGAEALLAVDFSHCEDGHYSPSLMDTLLVTPLLLIVLLIVPAGLLASGLLVFFFRRRLREMIKDVRW